MMSPPQSQNSCNRIKSAKSAVYQTYHMDIRHATSANERQHNQSSACMCQGVCTLVAQHRHQATTCTINKDLCDSGIRCRPTKSSNSKATLLFHCLYWSWPVHIAQSMLAMDCPHWQCFVHIAKSFSSVECSIFPCPAYNISQRLHTYYVACANLESDVSQWLVTFTRPAHMSV